MRVRQRHTVGALLCVPLDDRWHAYAWTLPEVDFAFFDLRADSEVAIEEIVAHPIAFRVGVHKSAWTTGRWLRVGKAEPPADVLAPVPTFIEDPISGKFSIYLLGKMRPAKREECVGFERCAVWEPEHVEDRLRDHFAGVPNKWVENLRLRRKLGAKRSD
jgi:hypothetical protein